MKKLLYILAVFFVILGLPARVMAQYNLPENYIWAFGYHMGMNFSGANPVPISTSIDHGEGCASVCNPNGQLLFYTNGSKIWAANGSLFPNGQNLDIPELITVTTTQTALIVPIPNQTNKYYLFTLGQKLYCYKIDMALNGGAGDVDITFPLTHVALKDSLSEKMIALRGCDNNVWVVVKHNYQNQFYSFNVTTQGVNTAAVVSNAGFTVPQGYFQLTMTASPDGNKIVANTSTTIELFHFDKTNGKVANDKIIDNQFGYASCFSPDGRLLYTNANDIYQYDLTACNPAATKRKAGNGFLGDIKLAPNGKIYFRSGVTGITASHNYLGSIEKPDVYGPGCQSRDSVTGTAMPILNPNSFGTFSMGLTNTVIKASQEEAPLNRRYFDSCVCQFPFGTGLDLNAAPGFQNYQWSDGGTAATLNVRKRGTYWVNYLTSCGRRFDTFVVRGNVVPVTLTYNAPSINTSGSYQSYKWYKESNLIAGAAGSSYQPLTSGVYSVLVTDTAGCTDSASININITTIGGGNEPTAFNVSVYPNPTADLIYIQSPVAVDAVLTDISGRVLLQTHHEKIIDISQFRTGIYLIKITDNEGRLVTVKKLIKKAWK